MSRFAKAMSPQRQMAYHCGGVFWIFDKARRASIGMFCTIPTQLMNGNKKVVPYWGKCFLSIKAVSWLVQFKLPQKNCTSNHTSNTVLTERDYWFALMQANNIFNISNKVFHFGIICLILHTQEFIIEKNVLIRNQYNLPAGVFVATLFVTEFQNGKHRC